MTLTSRTFGWMRDGIGNLRAAREIEAFLSLGQVGRVFWFDPIDGADGNGGERADDAKGTFQGAIDLTAADRGDLIIRMRGYDQPSATVNFNKQGITAIAENFGMHPHGQGEFFATDTSNTDGPAARITASCRLYGLGFVGVQASGDPFTATVVIDTTGAAADAYATWLHGCRFMNWNRAAVNHGVLLRGGAQIHIEDCAFQGGAGNALDAGVLLDNDVTGGGGVPVDEVYVTGNNFSNCTYAIEVVAGSQYGKGFFKGNVVNHSAPDSAWGRFLLDNSAVASAGITKARIDDNYIGLANTASYYNSSGAMTVADLETYGYRFGGNHYTADG